MVLWVVLRLLQEFVVRLDLWGELLTEVDWFFKALLNILESVHSTVYLAFLDMIVVDKINNHLGHDDKLIENQTLLGDGLYILMVLLLLPDNLIKLIF